MKYYQSYLEFKEDGPYIIKYKEIDEEELKETMKERLNSNG